MIYVDEDIWGYDLNQSLEQVSEQRRAHALRYVKEEDRRLSVAAYLLLCKGLEQEYGLSERLEFGYEKNGKPYLIGYPEIHFNLSHTKDVCACVISDHPVGIDVERILHQDEEVMRRTMNEEEMAEIDGSNNPEATFIRLWTMKESLLKLTGEGLCDDLPGLLVNKEDFHFTTETHDGYVLSVCELANKNKNRN